MLPRRSYALVHMAYQQSLNHRHKPYYIQTRPTPLQLKQRSVLFGAARLQYPNGHLDLRSENCVGHTRSLASDMLNDSAPRYRQKDDVCVTALEQAVDELSSCVCDNSQKDSDLCDEQPESKRQLQAIEKAQLRVLNALAVYLPSQCDQQGRLSSAGSAKLFQVLALFNVTEQKLQALGKASPQLRSAERSAQQSPKEFLQSCATAGVVATGVISFWRGIWFLWDGLVFPDNPLLSGCLSASVGLCVLVGARSFDLALAPPLPKLTQNEKEKSAPPDLYEAHVNFRFASQQKAQGKK